MEFEPALLAWDEGSAAAPKTITVRAAASGFAKIGNITASTANFETKTETIKESTEYRITVTPKRTTKPELAFLSIEVDSGAAVIGASGGLQFGLESADLRQGVFTHWLVEGVSTGAADLDKDGRILTSELHRYLADQVQNLTQGRQRPIAA